MVLKRLKKITGLDKGNKVSKPEDVPDWAKDKVEQATANRADSSPSAPPSPPPAPSEPSISPMGEATAPVDTAAAESAATESAAAEAAAAEAAAGEAAAAEAASAPQPVTYTVVSGDLRCVYRVWAR